MGKETWEKEFEKRFVCSTKYASGFYWWKQNPKAAPKKVKSFIRNLLKEKDEVIKEQRQEIDALERREV